MRRRSKVKYSHLARKKRVGADYILFNEPGRRRQLFNFFALNASVSPGYLCVRHVKYGREARPTSLRSSVRPPHSSRNN